MSKLLVSDKVSSEKAYSLIKQTAKLALVTTSLLAVLANFTACSTEKSIDFSNKKGGYNIVIPDGLASIDIKINIERGDTLSEIASRYYNSDYNKIFGNFDNYLKAIASKNNLSSIDSINLGSTLVIPIVFNDTNEYYIRIKSIETQMANLPRYCSYTVKLGDSLVGIAGLSSIDETDRYNIIDEIKRINNLSDNSIYENQKIKIVNPELRALKIELLVAVSELEESLQISAKSK